MQPKAFLDFAQELLKKHAASEAALRSCVSRSYYGLFNHAAQFIDEYVEKLLQDASNHDRIVRYLSNSKIEAVEDIAASLGDLRGERNIADYDLDNSKFNQMYVTLLFKKAEIAYNSFDKLIRNKSKRSQIIKKVNQYIETITPPLHLNACVSYTFSDFLR